MKWQRSFRQNRNDIGISFKGISWRSTYTTNQTSAAVNHCRLSEQIYPKYIKRTAGSRYRFKSVMLRHNWPIGWLLILLYSHAEPISRYIPHFLEKYASLQEYVRSIGIKPRNFLNWALKRKHCSTFYVFSF